MNRCQISVKGILVGNEIFFFDIFRIEIKFKRSSINLVFFSLLKFNHSPLKIISGNTGPNDLNSPAIMSFWTPASLLQS